MTYIYIPNSGEEDNQFSATVLVGCNIKHKDIGFEDGSEPIDLSGRLIHFNYYCNCSGG